MKKVGGVIDRIIPSRIISIKRFKKGLINKTYDVKLQDRSLVFRYYPKDRWKIEKEKHLYNLISKRTDVPVPKIIKTGRDYLLMSKVEGRELNLKNKVLVKKSGEYLAKIHSIKFPYYGWIIKNRISPIFKNWQDFINYDINLKFKKIPGQDKLKKDIKKIIRQNKELLNINSRPCLLHKDYHSSHIIADKKINGIIDLEWAMSGHNEFDIAKSCLWMFDKKPELEKTFLQGYNKHSRIPKEFNKRKELYKLIVLLSALSFSHECRHKKWCVYNLKRLKGAINEYNKTY